MIPFLACLAGFAIVILSAQMGAKMGAFVALSGTLSALIGMLVAFRYWFLLSQVIERTETPVPMHTVILFWAVFSGTAYTLSRVRQNNFEVFESTRPSPVDRVLGGVFGAGTGMVVMAALMMTVSMLSAEFWPGYAPEQLPLPVDHWAQQGYQFIEGHVAGIGAKDPGHTPLPSLNEKDAKKPGDVWK